MQQKEQEQKAKNSEDGQSQTSDETVDIAIVYKHPKKKNSR